MDKPLNILLITADQMRRDHTGFGGNPVIRTPHLDELAATGVSLDRAYVANPLCMPNRASIATGRMPSGHGVWCNGIPLAESERTVADVLDGHGYHTALIGKGHLTCFGADASEQRPYYDSVSEWKTGGMTVDWHGPYYGFKECSLAIGHGSYGMEAGHYGAWLRQKHPGAIERAKHTTPSPTGAMQCFTPDQDVETHCSTWLGDVGSEYLRQRAEDGTPFMAWVSFPDPHHPFCPPAPYDTMYNPDDVVMPRFGAEALDDKPEYYRRARDGGEMWEGIGPSNALSKTTDAQLREIIARTYGMISLMDENIGRLLKTLDETGLAQNTIVIFTSDHGDLMGDCGLVFKGPFHLDGLVNVPMLWRVPGGNVNIHTDGLFSSCDITPTILQLLGIELPGGLDGLGQADLVRGGDAVRDAAIVEFKSVYHTELNLRTIVTADRKLTYYPNSLHNRRQGLDVGELYDMTKDVPERRNLYGDRRYASDRAELEARLLDENLSRGHERDWPICHA